MAATPEKKFKSIDIAALKKILNKELHLREAETLIGRNVLLLLENKDGDQMSEK